MTSFYAVSALSLKDVLSLFQSLLFILQGPKGTTGAPGLDGSPGELVGLKEKDVFSIFRIFLKVPVKFKITLLALTKSV